MTLAENRFNFNCQDNFFPDMKVINQSECR
jgi:hypothetical protein